MNHAATGCVYPINCTQFSNKKSNKKKEENTTQFVKDHFSYKRNDKMRAWVSVEKDFLLVSSELASNNHQTALVSNNLKSSSFSIITNEKNQHSKTRTKGKQKRRGIQQLWLIKKSSNSAACEVERCAASALVTRSRNR